MEILTNQIGCETMNTSERKKHWENIYQTKSLNEVSWYQPIPETSLNFFKDYQVPTNAKVIDIGGGDGFLVDHLLDLGYTDITVLDISEAAINRAKLRLGEQAKKVKWMVADVATFSPSETYDFWHDRAAFHFLTEEKDIANYLQTAYECLSSKGILVVGTFSDHGPKKCSGIAIKEYSEASMTERFQEYFEKIHCTTVDHQTPFDTLQNFVFCSFKKLVL